MASNQTLQPGKWKSEAQIQRNSTGRGPAAAAKKTSPSKVSSVSILKGLRMIQFLVKYQQHILKGLPWGLRW